MARLKLMACSESGPGGVWDSLSDAEKTRLVRAYPAAIWGTEQEMQDTVHAFDPSQKTYAELTQPELNELRRVRNAMRTVYERERGPIAARQQ